MNKLIYVLLATAELLTAQSTLAEEVVEIETPRGVGQKFLLDVPDKKPTAIVILFAGGKGPSVTGLPLQQVKIPTLITHHR